jgi:DNA-directed RNA polymerase subunit M/transcription elongation factor TFIIS
MTSNNKPCCEKCGKPMIYVTYLGGRLDEECLDHWKCEKCGNIWFED